jgi:hypothetical protein
VIAPAPGPGTRGRAAGPPVHFRAPWSPKLRAFTATFLAIIAVDAAVTPPLPRVLVVGVAALTAAFSVRGYTVRDRTLLVHRLGWATKIPLAGLRSVAVEPSATAGSIRLFGVGGAFAFAGRFRNEILGTYRAYVTDESRTVVLAFDDERVVVTPDSPARFAEVVRQQAGIEG